jgi:Fe-S-cluster containining protein
MAENNNFEEEAVKFNCEKCGECCRHLESFVFIWPHQQNGVCNFLKGDLCSIYEDRPDFCNFKRWFKYYKGTTTEKIFYTKLKNNCDLLKKMKETGGDFTWFYGLFSKNW